MERVRYLPRETRVHAIVERCREAGVAFVQGTTGPFGPRELATWLVEHYEPATAPTRSIVRRSSPPGDRRIDEATLERVVLDARARLFEMLDKCTTAWSGESFARDMVDGKLVVGVQDEGGAIGYAPVRYRDMRLVDRVVSLFVADYLTRPSDYVTLIGCEECGDLAYDGVPSHAHWCEKPPANSEVVPAFDEDVTLPGLSAVPRG